MTNPNVRYCTYLVSSVEGEGCKELLLGEAYAFECDCFCNEVYIDWGPCAGTLLTPLDPECRYQ